LKNIQDNLLFSNISFILKSNEQVSFDRLEVIGFHKLGDYNIVASGEPIN